MLYRVAILPDVTRLRSCLDDTPWGGMGAGLLATAAHLAGAEWLANSHVRLLTLAPIQPLPCRAPPVRRSH